MLEKYINLDVYNTSKDNILRQVALLLTSFIPVFLLFSRVAADASLTITGILFLIHSIKSKDYSFMNQPMIRVILLLWLWFMFSSIFAVHSRIDSFATSFVYIRFILFFIASTCWLFTEIKALKFAAKIITITLLVTACDALWQFFTGFSINGNPKYDLVRLTSFLKRPDIGIYLLKLIFPISGLWIWLAIRTGDKKNLFLSCSLLLFAVSIICLTGERTATALTLLILILSLLAIGINSKSLRLYMILAICSVIIAFIMVIYNSLYIKVRALGFINDISNFWPSVYGQLFKASLLSWQEHIFTGVGLQQFRHSCLMLEQQAIVTYCTTHSHNIYLEILSETGLIGFILFVTFVILGAYKALATTVLNHKNPAVFTSTVFVLAGLSTIFFPISVTMSFITNWSATLNWLGISLCISLLNLTASKQ